MIHKKNLTIFLAFMNVIIPLPINAQILIAQPSGDFGPSQPLPSIQDTPRQPQTSPPVPEIRPSPTTPQEIPQITQTITVTDFKFTGNTVFSDEELREKVTQGLTNQPITLSRLLQVATDVGQLYADAGYSTSGAVVEIPEITQQQGNGVVEIQIIEGKLEAINVIPLDESERLNPGYLRSRLEAAIGTPFNIRDLQKVLQLLLVNPLIETISAQIADGSETGTSILTIKYASADTFRLEAILDNNRAPSVGSFRRSAFISEGNLLGFGDDFRIGYGNTDGSNSIEGAYNFPINPYNGTVGFAFRYIDSEIVKPPFNRFDIESEYQQYIFTLRQPISQTLTQDIALGLTFDRQQSSNFLANEKFPLSPGNNLEGETNISTLRFFQEWIERAEDDIISLRSSFNFGLEGVLGTTEPFDKDINPDAPESGYFMWRGQVQWLRSFAPDFFLLTRGNIQISNDPLVPIEQFVLGGSGTIRGYGQNFRLSDSGVVGSVELRILVYRDPDQQMVFQVIPFLDIGTGWNVGETSVPSPSTLASLGFGLLWQQSDKFSARIDWGIPLTEYDQQGNTWQENGVYFSVIYNFF